MIKIIIFFLCIQYAIVFFAFLFQEFKRKKDVLFCLIPFVIYPYAIYNAIYEISKIFIKDIKRSWDKLS